MLNKIVIQILFSVILNRTISNTALSHNLEDDTVTTTSMSLNSLDKLPQRIQLYNSTNEPFIHTNRLLLE